MQGNSGITLMVKNFINKLYGVIDVGSNSVRLMMWQNGKTLYKKVNVTKLAEGLGKGSKLQVDAIDRTARAVSFFVNEARKEKTDEIFVFATAAVRQASNGEDFTNKVKALCNIDVDVISGELEAEIGLLGAVSKGDGGIIDIGGASTEISVLTNGDRVFGKTLPFGCVKITEICGQNLLVADEFVRSKIVEYGLVPSSNFYGIGGTATTIAAILLELEVYDPAKVHGYVVSKEQILSLRTMLYEKSIEERKKIKGLQPQRAEVIVSGVALLYAIMDTFNIEKITVSESDNLEGYVLKKMENL